LNATKPFDKPNLPDAPGSIQKGVPLKNLFNAKSIEYLANNISWFYPSFDSDHFKTLANDGLETLTLMDRSTHIATALHQCLPPNYLHAIRILLGSFTPEHTSTDDSGLASFFYLPHSAFISKYGLSAQNNEGEDPFDTSMNALYELTKRFTAEFAIRPFLIQQPQRTLQQIMCWLDDPNPHVRRLCSEGTRPRLPWGKRIPSFISNPDPLFPILDALKDDETLYVRRSVANHLGDIAKDHPERVFALCETWLLNATTQRKWLIRHALRHPAKKGNTTALRIRKAAK
jgi:3-methyladenine DNA glycosylase AlkC